MGEVYNKSKLDTTLVARYFSTMLKEKSKFASVKLARPLLARLKVEAAKREVPLYELIAKLVDLGLSHLRTGVG